MSLTDPTVYLISNTSLLGIRANPSQGTTGFTGGINSAILRYSGAPDADPTSIRNIEGIALNEADLHPLVNPGAVSSPDCSGYLNLAYLWLDPISAR